MNRATAMTPRVFTSPATWPSSWGGCTGGVSCQLAAGINWARTTQIQHAEAAPQRQESTRRCCETSGSAVTSREALLRVAGREYGTCLCGESGGRAQQGASRGGHGRNRLGAGSLQVCAALHGARAACHCGPGLVWGEIRAGETRAVEGAEAGRRARGGHRCRCCSCIPPPRHGAYAGRSAGRRSAASAAVVGLGQFAARQASRHAPPWHRCGGTRTPPGASKPAGRGQRSSWFWRGGSV